MTTRTNSAAIFTVVLDFRGGTYVEQVRSGDERLAVIDWVRNLDPTKIDGLSEEQRRTLSRAVQDDAPMGVEGLRSVWCSSAELDDELALINIIKTQP